MLTDCISFSLYRKLLMHPAEDYAKLQLFHRGGNRRLVHNMWSYQLHKKCSAIFHHVLCSEGMKQGLVHLNIIRSRLAIPFIADLGYSILYRHFK